jgi:Leucine-rich repeat (LRR) protein
MPISRSLSGVVAVALFAMSQGAYAQSPLPQLMDSSFRACLSEQAAKNGWTFAEDVTTLNCANRGIMSLIGVSQLTNLSQLELPGNQISTVYELGNLSRLTKLNLAGNPMPQGGDIGIAMTRLPALTSLNLNGINIGSIRNLNGLNNPSTGQKWQFVELDLGNTHLMDENNGKALEFLRAMPSLKKLNLEGNGILNTDGISQLPALEELNLANNDLPFIGNLRYGTLTRLNLSGNRQLMVQDVAQIINGNPGLSSLGLNGIAIGSINNLGRLTDWRNGQPMNLTELDLGNTGIKDANGEATLLFLRPFPNLRKLNVANSAIREVYPLDTMPQMEELDLSGNQLTVVGNLAQMHNLTRLNLSGNRSLRIDDVASSLLVGNPKLSSIGLNGIRIWVNNYWLDQIAYNRDQALALQELDLGNTDLDTRSLTSLQAFPNLQRLNLAGNHFPPNTGLYALRDLIKLQDLDLSDNQVSDLTSFYNLHTLKRLNLGNTPLRVDDARWLISQNPGLTSIGLNGIAIGGDISRLGDLRNSQTWQYLDLTELDLGNTGLMGSNGNSGFGFLRNFPNLQRLNLAGNAIFDAQEIRDLPNLQDLDVSNNRLQFFPFSSQTRLNRLNLSGNTALRAYDVAGWINQNPGLQSLGLNGITIGAFSNLGSLINTRTNQPLNLTELDLGNTDIKDANGSPTLQFLQPFFNLRKLNAANNALTDTGNIGGLMQLEELDLSGNQLADVAYLFPLHDLTRINLSGNRLLNMGQVGEILRGNRSLNSIGLNGLDIGRYLDWLMALSNNSAQALGMKELDLGNTDLDVNVVNFLSAFSNLQRLNLAGNGFPEYSSLYYLRDLSKLRDLDLSGNAIRELSMLNNMYELQRLNLSNTLVNVEDVRHLIGYTPNLTSLGLNGVAIGNISNLGEMRNNQTGQYLNLTELDLGNTGLLGTWGHNGFQFLTNFPNLQRLNMAGNAINDIAGLWNMSKMLDLDLSNNNLLYIPLGRMSNLQRLNLSGNLNMRASDVRELISGNPGLTSLGLNGVGIGSINNLPPLVDTRTGQAMALTELDLGNTGLLDQNGQKNISFLAPFGKLQRLNLAGNGLVDVAMLGAFANLRDLDLSNNALVDVASLGNLRNLSRLNLSGNSSLNPAPLRALIDQSWNLTSLGLNGIELRDFLGAVGNMYNPRTGRGYDLEELDLGNTRLSANGDTTTNRVWGFTRLKRLNLAGNGLVGSIYLDQMRGLNELDLSNNQFSEVRAANVAGLNRLNLSGNSGLTSGNVGSILKQNPGLTRIGLNGIALDSLANIGGFTGNWQLMKLVELDIGNTAMRDIDGLNFLQSFPGITRLNLAGNGLQSLNGVRYLPVLSDLDLSNNTTLRWLNDLNITPNLKTLSLAGDTALECLGLDGFIQAYPNVAITRPATCVTQNLPPVANAGANQTVASGSSVTLSGSATDLDGTIASYDWLQTAGPAVTLAAPKAATTTFVAPVVAVDTVFTFQLSVLDDKGASASNTTNVTVKAKPNLPPVANAGNAQTVTAGSTVALSGSGTDVDGSIASYKWLQTAGTALTLATPNAAGTTFVAPVVSTPTVFTFQLTVFDDKGASASASVSITVNPAVNVAPTVSAGSAKTVTEGSLVTLAGTGSDSDGTIVSYTWLQTAGPSVTLATPNAASTSFTAPQVSSDSLLTFRLTVTDNRGASTSASTNVTVKDAADLVVSGISVLASQTNPPRGSTIAVTVYTKNSGNKSTTAASNTALYLTTSATTVTTSDLLLRSVSVPSGLAAGATTTSSTSITIPSTLAPGVYYIGAIADYTGKAAEANEGNNSLVGTKITAH